MVLGFMLDARRVLARVRIGETIARASDLVACFMRSGSFLTQYTA
jgi:hypothetical protein